MHYEGTTEPLILLSTGPDGRLLGASTARTLTDLQASGADLRAYLGDRRPDSNNSGGAQAA